MIPNTWSHSSRTRVTTWPRWIGSTDNSEKYKVRVVVEKEVKEEEEEELKVFVFIYFYYLK